MMMGMRARFVALVLNLGLSMCDKSQLMYGIDYIDTHTCNK